MSPPTFYVSLLPAPGPRFSRAERRTRVFLAAAGSKEEFFARYQFFFFCKCSITAPLFVMVDQFLEFVEKNQDAFVERLRKAVAIPR